MTRPTRAEINTDALRHNYAHAQALAGDGRCIPVIKANAYGHGVDLVARALAKQAPAFAVACLDEALALRSMGVEQPLLLLEGVFDIAEVNTAALNNCWVMVSSANQVDLVTSAKPESTLSIWLKVDTGMHRLGIMPSELELCYQRLQRCEYVAKGVVLATHMASADELEKTTTQQQLEIFKGATEGLNALLSIANSAGVMAWPESRADWNRVGYMLYGNSPLNAAHESANALRPVMTLRSQVLALRTIEAGERVGYTGAWSAARRSVIATIPVGYGDGYPRSAQNGCPVLINGQRAPLVGRVSMDMITADVTDLDAVAIGDDVTLWGDGLSVDDVARASNTIGYELLTRMPERPPRVEVRG